MSVSALVAAGCSSTLSTYRCEVDNDCESERGDEGACEANSFCSFADVQCGEDGRRYSENSGELSNQCVNAAEGDAGGVVRIDSGVPDARSPDANVADADLSAPDAAPSGSASFQQDTDSYSSTVDTYISLDKPNEVNGGKSDLVCEEDTGDYALVRFDEIFGAQAGQIPVGASIAQATLTVVVNDGTSTATSVRESTVDWDESTSANTFGAMAGVQDSDMHPGVVADLPGASGAQAIDVTASVSRWASGERTNFGWIFVSNDINDHRFRSSEYQSAISQKPLLVVDYFWP